MDAPPTPSGPHFSADDITGLLVQPGLDAATSRRLVDHLGAHCRTCWASLKAAKPYAWQGPDTTDPALAALRRLSARDKRWMRLRGRHIEAATQAFDAPQGFAFLVIEEAAAMAGREDFELATLAAALGLDPDADEPPDSSEAAELRRDLFCQYSATAGLVGLARNDLEAVHRAFDIVGRPELLTAVELEESRLKVLELNARCARELGDLEGAREDLLRAYGVSRDQAFRQLDVGLELGSVLVEIYRGHEEEVAGLVADTSELLQILLRTKDLSMRVFLVLSLARFLHRLDTELRAHPRTDDDPPPGDGPVGRTLYVTDVAPIELIATVYEFLKTARPYFEALDDPQLRAERCRYLFSFSLFVDTERAAALARELETSLERLGADHWHEALAAKAVRVALERRRDPAGAKKAAAELREELAAWLGPEQVGGFLEQIAEVLPSADLRDLMGDDDRPPSVS